MPALISIICLSCDLLIERANVNQRYGPRQKEGETGDKGRETRDTPATQGESREAPKSFA